MAKAHRTVMRLNSLMDHPQNQRNKDTARKLWAALDSDPAQAVPMLDKLQGWHGPAPFGMCTSGEDVVAQMFAPLRQGFPNLTRLVHFMVGGVSDAFEDGTADGAYWVGGTGYYVGRPQADVFGIPATDQTIRLRWTDFLKFDADGNIVYAQTIWDFVDWFDQIGRPALPRPLGAMHVYPAPTDYLGILNDPQDAAVSADTLRFGRDFIFGGLNGFDENDLSSMGMADYFHPNLKWYGPGGIGGCLSFKEFEDLHQSQWLIAFPNRKVLHLESLFAEDRVLAASGPRGVVATHTGPYLGQAPTGVELEVSGIDFWLKSGNTFTENWVFVDMVHLFGQMGVDLFAKMRGDA